MAHVHCHVGADRVARGETPHARADMNVTPLIDVLLVLLIIFMSTKMFWLFAPIQPPVSTRSIHIIHRGETVSLQKLPSTSLSAHEILGECA